MTSKILIPQGENETPVYWHPGGSNRHTLMNYAAPLPMHVWLDDVRALHDPDCKVYRLKTWPDGTTAVIPPGASPDDILSLYIAARLALMLKLAIPLGNA